MAEWIGIAFAIVASLIPLIKAFGYDQRRLEDMEQKLDDAKQDLNAKCARFDRMHGEHYKHAVDRNEHWTSREREQMDKRLTEIYDEIKAVRDKLQ